MEINNIYLALILHKVSSFLRRIFSGKMDYTKESRIYVGDGVPLNSNSNVYLNIGNPQNVISQKGLRCEITPERIRGRDTLRVCTTHNGKKSSKIKFLYILNVCICVISIAVSCTFSVFWWNEVEALKRELLNVKSQRPDSYQEKAKYNEPTRPIISNTFIEEKPKVEVDENILEKNNQFSKALPSTGLLVAHYSGAAGEVNLGLNLIIGPWYLDTVESSIDTDRVFNLVYDSNIGRQYVIVKEEGLYLVYAQMTYLTNSPNTFHVWGRQPGREPRRLSTCSTGDVTHKDRGITQLSCSTQTVARLFPNDTVNLSQREVNRTVWLEAGRSYFGFIKISA